MQSKHHIPDASTSDASGIESTVSARHAYLSLPDFANLSLVGDYASSNSSGSPAISQPSSPPNPVQLSFLTETNFVSYDNVQIRRTPTRKRASLRVRRSTFTEPINFAIAKIPSSTDATALVKADAERTTFTGLKQYSDEMVIKEESRENVLNEQAHKTGKSQKELAKRVSFADFCYERAVWRGIHRSPLDSAMKIQPQATTPSATPSFCPHVGPDDGAVERLTLCLSCVPGLDIRPKLSPYQLAAMVTLSPKSYSKAMQPTYCSILLFSFPLHTRSPRQFYKLHQHLTSISSLACDSTRHPLAVSSATFHGFHIHKARVSVRTVTAALTPGLLEGTSFVADTLTNLISQACQWLSAMQTATHFASTMLCEVLTPQFYNMRMLVYLSGPLVSIHL